MFFRKCELYLPVQNIMAQMVSQWLPEPCYMVNICKLMFISENNLEKLSHMIDVSLMSTEQTE